MWHQPRVEGISSQTVMEVVINKTHTQPKKTGTGMTYQLYEARTAWTDLSKFLEKITEIDPTCEINNTDNSIRTRFGYSPPGSFGSYQLAFSESNFKVTTSFKPGSAKQTDSGSLPKFPSLPVDDFNDNFTINIPKDLNNKKYFLMA